MVDKKDRTKNGPMTITTKSLDFQNKQKWKGGGDL